MHFCSFFIDCFENAFMQTREGNMTPASRSHIAEKLSGLLQQPHQAAFGEVAS